MTVLPLPDLGLQYGATLGEGSFAVYVVIIDSKLHRQIPQAKF